MHTQTSHPVRWASAATLAALLGACGTAPPSANAPRDLSDRVVVDARSAAPSGPAAPGVPTLDC